MEPRHPGHGRDLRRGRAGRTGLPTPAPAPTDPCPGRPTAAAFAMATPFEAGVDTEVEQGALLAS
jgi:hypothetical protein